VLELKIPMLIYAWLSNGSGTAATAKMMSTDIPILVDWLIMGKLWI